VTLHQRMLENRRHNLMTLDLKELEAHNRRYAVECAATMGSIAGKTYYFLGIPRMWGPRDYVKYVIEPLYVGNGMGSGLWDSWQHKCRGARCSDRRVKAFIRAAKEAGNVS